MKIIVTKGYCARPKDSQASKYFMDVVTGTEGVSRTQAEMMHYISALDPMDSFRVVTYTLTDAVVILFEDLLLKEDEKSFEEKIKENRKNAYETFERIAENLNNSDYLKAPLQEIDFPPNCTFDDAQARAFEALKKC